MAQTPSYFINSPVSGTRYTADNSAAILHASGDSVTATCKAWSGANGTGSLVQVTTLSVWLHDNTTASDRNTNSGNFNTVSCADSAAAAGDVEVPSGEWQGAQSVGSLELFLTYTTSTPYGIVRVNTGTPASPVWTVAVAYVNTGTPASPVWTAVNGVSINTGTPASPVWTPTS